MSKLPRGNANAGRPARSQRTQSRSALNSRRWPCARHHDAHFEDSTGGSVDFHSAMPENKSVAAGVAEAFAAANNGSGGVV